jgi:hypothetical protein
MMVAVASLWASSVHVEGFQIAEDTACTVYVTDLGENRPRSEALRVRVLYAFL